MFTSLSASSYAHLSVDLSIRLCVCLPNLPHHPLTHPYSAPYNPPAHINFAPHSPLKPPSSAPHNSLMPLQITSAQSDDYSDIPNSQIRRITAKRLLESKQTVPHYYLTIDCRVDKLVQLRQQLNAGLAKDGKKLSVNDFVIKASAQVCTLLPLVGFRPRTAFFIIMPQQARSSSYMSLSSAQFIQLSQFILQCTASLFAEAASDMKACA